MTQETFEQAKALLAKIAELEKKGKEIPEIKAVKISVSYNGVSFTDASTILDADTLDSYKSDIASSCNDVNKNIGETISKLYSQFFKL